jgi:hypothetical protein
MKISGFSTANTSKAVILSALHLHTPEHLQPFIFSAGQGFYLVWKLDNGIFSDGPSKSFFSYSYNSLRAI